MGALTSKEQAYKSRSWELNRRFTYTKDFEAIFVFIRSNKIFRIKAYDTNEWQKDYIQSFRMVYSNKPVIKIAYMSNKTIEIIQRSAINILNDLENVLTIPDVNPNIDFDECIKSLEFNTNNNYIINNPNYLLFKNLIVLNKTMFNIGFVVDIGGHADAIIPGKGYFNERLKRIDFDGELHDVLPVLEKVQMSTQGGLTFAGLTSEASFNTTMKLAE